MNENDAVKRQEMIREETVPMDCGRFEEVQNDLDRPGTPGLALREAALVHAETCGRCAQLMTDHEALDFALQSLGVRDADVLAPPRVEAALLQQLRRQKAVAARKEPWWIALLGAAAVAVLVLGLSVRHTRLGRFKTDGGNGATAHSTLGLSSRGGPPQGTEVAENVSSDLQDATAFVSLPYAADPATLEGGTVVRVELSRSALASMGMPVADVGATDRIPADIMLSEDGAPQAIRLIASASLDH